VLLVCTGRLSKAACRTRLRVLHACRHQVAGTSWLAPQGSLSLVVRRTIRFQAVALLFQDPSLQLGTKRRVPGPMISGHQPGSRTRVPAWHQAQGSRTHALGHQVQGSRTRLAGRHLIFRCIPSRDRHETGCNTRPTEPGARWNAGQRVTTDQLPTASTSTARPSLPGKAVAACLGTGKLRGKQTTWLPWFDCGADPAK